jgi:hypothetical protein
MKTPIQELIQALKSYANTDLDNQEMWMLVAEDAERLLEKEKSTIQQAFYEGMLCQGFDPNMGRAETYYNNVYKNSKQ